MQRHFAPVRRDPPPGPAEDPVQRLFDVPAVGVQRLRRNHWFGIAVLIAVVGVTAAALPPLLTDPTPSPAPPLGAAVPTASVTATAVASATTSIEGPAPGLRPSGSPAVTGPAPATGTARRPAALPDADEPPARATNAPAPTTTPTRTPLATKSPDAMFRPLSMPAENAVLSDGARIVDCATCDGGARVRYVGRVDARFDVPVAGRRTITIRYQASGTRRLAVALNGGTPVAELRLTGSDWKTPRTATVEADIPAGAVTIILTSGGGGAPDIDTITIG